MTFNLQKYEADQEKEKKEAQDEAAKKLSRGGKFKSAKSDTMPSIHATIVEPPIATYKMLFKPSRSRVCMYKNLWCNSNE